MKIQLYNAVILCQRDDAYIDGHIARVDELLATKGMACSRCFYYGMDLNGFRANPRAEVDYHVVPFLDLYENLPLKTYALLEHAIGIPGWTHLLKTDVNSHPTAIDMDQVAKHHLVGYCATIPPGREGHWSSTWQPGLKEPYLGKLPSIWCGGPAYVMSRLLATMVVNRGAWYARGWPWEDVMVSQIAAENNWPAVPGVGYWTDGRDWRQEDSNET